MDRAAAMVTFTSSSYPGVLLEDVEMLWCHMEGFYRRCSERRIVAGYDKRMQGRSNMDERSCTLTPSVMSAE